MNFIFKIRFLVCSDIENWWKDYCFELPGHWSSIRFCAWVRKCRFWRDHKESNSNCNVSSFESLLNHVGCWRYRGPTLTWFYSNRISNRLSLSPKPCYLSNQHCFRGCERDYLLKNCSTEYWSCHSFCIIFFWKEFRSTRKFNKYELLKSIPNAFVIIACKSG